MRGNARYHGLRRDLSPQTTVELTPDPGGGSLRVLVAASTLMTATTAAAGGQVGADISFGYTLPAPPTVHYIPAGTPPPAGCC